MKKEKLNILFHEDTRSTQEEYTREQICKGRCANGTSVSIYGDKEHWTAFKDEYVYTVFGPRMFWKKTISVQATYKNGKFYGSIEPFIPYLLKVFNIDWIPKWGRVLLKSDKYLWKQVLSGKITNPEILCKKFSKKYFKGVFSYASLREYAEKGCSTSLYDIYFYTKNPEESLKWFLHHSYDPLIGDVLNSCKVLNTKMSPMWSERRLKDEHQLQIEEINRAKIENITAEEVALPYSNEGLSLILNERSCYIEGLNMHNCVHSCYWKRIASGDYLLAKGSINGQYVNLGLRAYDGKIVFDQIHTIYNGIPNDDVKQFCTQWINTHREELKEIAEEIKWNNKITMERKGITEPEILPF